MHGKATADVFGKNMRDELKGWTDRRRLVRGVESTAGEVSQGSANDGAGKPFGFRWNCNTGDVFFGMIFHHSSSIWSKFMDER